jgi:hypothetical protein
MNENAVNVQIVIQVFLLVEGRQEAFVNMMTRFDQCSKSLNEYLDQKKIDFTSFQTLYVWKVFVKNEQGTKKRGHLQDLTKEFMKGQ